MKMGVLHIKMGFFICKKCGKWTQKWDLYIKGPKTNYFIVKTCKNSRNAPISTNKNLNYSKCVTCNLYI
jgi:hypothetical protein